MSTGNNHITPQHVFNEFIENSKGLTFGKITIEATFHGGSISKLIISKETQSRYVSSEQNKEGTK